MLVISASRILSDFCSRLSECPYVMVDTEFMREKTYWSRLCLVQLAGPGIEARAIDPLAEGLDMTPLFNLMANKSVLKVFHAARQDLEIFYNLTGNVPCPIFDTQIAAMVCGFGDAISYENLALSLAKVQVDKSSRFTDWARRPLTKKQIKYALADVTYLKTIYEKLSEKIKQRSHWLVEEMEILTNPATYVSDPRAAYRRIKGRNNKPRILAILRELATWREKEAQRCNVPRNRILKDETLLEIVYNTPDTVADLTRIRGIARHMAEGPMGKQIFQAIKIGQALPDVECPKSPNYISISHDIASILDLLKVLLKLSCRNADVATKLVASADDVKHIAIFGENADVRALQGWRREVFGEDALKLRDGRYALVVKNGKVNLVKLPPSK